MVRFFFKKFKIFVKMVKNGQNINQLSGLGQKAKSLAKRKEVHAVPVELAFLRRQAKNQ